MAQPKQPKVCQRKRRGKITYFCELGGTQYGLGTDPEAAQDLFADLLAKHRARKQLGIDEKPAEQPARKADAKPALTVRAVLFAFLERVKKQQSAATYRFYLQAISGTGTGKAKKRKPFVSFDDYLIRQGKADLLVADFGPDLVTDWIRDHFSAVSDNHKHNLMRPIQAAFNWAMKEPKLRRQIGDNPLVGLEKPAQTPRDAYVTAEQWAKIVAVVEGDFLDFLTILKETGVRPQEARLVEAQHFDREGRRWFFPQPVKKLRGKTKPRIVYLNDRAFEICQRLALKHPTGPLFRNQDGEPWKKNALNCRCKRIKAKLGFNLQPYALRHTFCTDALLRGVDPLTVAELMGHANGLMVMKVYQNLSKCTDHLRDALKRATG